jgi:hypothetical protein
VPLLSVMLAKFIQVKLAVEKAQRAIISPTLLEL